MTTDPVPPLLRNLRIQRGWTQAALAERAEISRAAVSAIEHGRLTPSVTAALALARALDVSVEQLFGRTSGQEREEQWAFEPPQRPGQLPCRYWLADVAGRRWRYPVEPTGVGELPHQGVYKKSRPNEPRSSSQLIDASPPALQPEMLLVIATCDPAVGLLAAEYARQTPYQLLPLTRSSGEALELLNQGKVHAAGVHLSSSKRAEGNASVVRQQCSADARLLRIGVWQEGIAFAQHLRLRSARAARGARLEWVGRQAGSGARQCLDELLDDRRPPRRVAPDHRSVALAVRHGWADAGVCLRLASEESGLGFLPLRREAYDLCFLAESEADPRIRTLVDVVQSVRYRQLLQSLPGYDAGSTGALSSC